MSLKDKLLFHQIHPFKLSVDILSAYGALWFYWQHQLLLGLVVTFVPPIVASVITIRFFDLAYLRKCTFGMYIEKHMPTGVALLRLAGNFVLLSGAWYHSIPVIVAGTVFILACWTWGLDVDWAERS